MDRQTSSKAYIIPKDLFSLSLHDSKRITYSNELDAHQYQPKQHLI